HVAVAGVGFVEDAVLTDGLSVHAEAFADPPWGGRAGGVGVAVVDEQVRVGGVGPGSLPAGQVGGQPQPDGDGERDDAVVDVQPSVAQVGQVQGAELSDPDGVEGQQRGQR